MSEVLKGKKNEVVNDRYVRQLFGKTRKMRCLTRGTFSRGSGREGKGKGIHLVPKTMTRKDSGRGSVKVSGRGRRRVRGKGSRER